MFRIPPASRLGGSRETDTRRPRHRPMDPAGDRGDRRTAPPPCPRTHRPLPSGSRRPVGRLERLRQYRPRSWRPPTSSATQSYRRRYGRSRQARPAIRVQRERARLRAAPAASSPPDPRAPGQRRSRPTRESSPKLVESIHGSCLLTRPASSASSFRSSVPAATPHGALEGGGTPSPYAGRGAISTSAVANQRWRWLEFC